MISLADILKDNIAAHGPVDVAQFMALALGHPEHGYYMKKDPFGADGDFTTAPEISQMFGEVIGAWTADLWERMGKPSPFILLECGPGRGTMMADILRGTKNIEGFHEACSIHLLEASPVLKVRQAETLQGYHPHWHATLQTLPARVPIIAIANEFLDALPMRQLVREQGGWHERMVSYSLMHGFHFVPGAKMMGEFPDALPGSIYEIAPARSFFVQELCKLIKQRGAAVLFLDYGHTKSGTGDTLQALHKHKYCSVFEHIGDADLTSHVDFEALHRPAADLGLAVHGPVEQGAFLKTLGIEKRAEYLKKKSKQPEEIEKALQRLIHSDQMGSLFKAICFSHEQAHPAGFL